jgi:mono/diheme cytochrome c family protein
MVANLVALANAALLLASPAGAQAPKKTPELLEKGRASFERNCSACHGDKGAGDGIAAAALTPKPRNFATERFKKGSKPAQIFETLRKGVPGSAMVPFLNLPEEERWALAYWVAELRGAGEAKR